jgi:4-aminobutyrate aminotransferase-like enzyme
MLPEILTSIPGPRSLALAERLSRAECRNTTYCNADWPVFWERAEGGNVWDADGNRFLDLTSAFGVATLGHGATASAAAAQAGRLVHAMGDVHPATSKVELCERLAQQTFGRWTGQPGKCLLGNSGFEAVEAALKTAVLATGRKRIVAFDGGYHGLGYGSLLGAGIPWFREPFEHQLAAVTDRLPYPRHGDAASMQAFRNALAKVDPSAIAAVLVEPYQGRGGIVVPPQGFLTELRAWCDSHGAVLVFDEIYTGFFRTGRWFACEHEAVVPDLICLGKALSGGFPISACVGRVDVMDAWPPTHGEALHTSTFLGNPVGCAMAIASLDTFADGGFQQIIDEATFAWDAALARLAGLPRVLEIRGPGLMKGIEFREPDGKPASEFVIAMVINLLKHGFIALPDAPEGHVLALTPPVVLDGAAIDAAVDAIAGIVSASGQVA